MKKPISYFLSSGLCTLLLITFCLCFIACDGSSTADKAADKGDAAAAETASDPKLLLLDERIAKDPDNAELYFSRGNMHLRLANVKSAMNDMKKAAELAPEELSYQLAHSELLFESRMLPQAALALRKNEAKHAENADFHSTLGKYYYYGAQYDSAQYYLDKAIALDGKDLQSYFWKAMLFKDQDKVDEAIASMNESVKIDPKFYNGHMMLGQLYSKKGDDNAIKHYDIAIELDDKSVEANYGKAMFLQEQKRYDEAIKAYKSLLMRNSQHEDSFFNLGYVYFQQAKYDKALSNFTFAASTAPADARCYYWRAMTHEKLGDNEKAVIDLKRALNFEPEHERALLALKRLRS